MTIVKLFSALLFFSWCLITHSTCAQFFKKTDWIKIKINSSCTRCQDCETCAQLIHNGGSAIKGVKKLYFNTEKKTANIYFNTNKTSPKKLRIAISKLGFDADDIKADSTAYAKLNLCCKKL